MTRLVTEYAGLCTYLVVWGCLIAIQSTFLISLGLAACAFLRHRSPALRSAILRATLLAVTVCPVVSHFGGLARIALPMPQGASVLSEPADSSVPPCSGEASQALVPLVNFRAPGAMRDTALSAPPAEVPHVRLGWPMLYMALSLAWLAGTMFLLVRFARRAFHARRLLHSAAAAPEAVVAACRVTAERMRVTSPHIMIHPEIGSPLLTGIFRPTILLPEAFPDAANDQVFAHELAHQCRRDCLWNALGTLATAVYFFQPLMWRLLKDAEQISEEVCDDFVLSYTGQAQSYARRLVEMAERLGYRSVPTFSIGVVYLTSSLGRRVQRLLSPGAVRAIGTGRVTRLLVTSIGVVSVGLAGLLGVRPAARAAAMTPIGSGHEMTEPDLRPLLAALASDDWRLREQAAITIAQRSGVRTAAIPGLIKNLADEQWHVRKAAAIALATMGPAARDAVSALVTALPDEEWQVRRAVAEALAVLGPAAQPAVPGLSIALGDNEWQVRRVAAAALARIGRASQPATPNLIYTLEDEQWHVREAAALALGAIGPEASSAIAALMKRLDDSEWRVRRATAEALEQIAAGDKAAIPQVINALLDSEWKKRQAAAEALQRRLQE